MAIQPILISAAFSPSTSGQVLVQFNTNVNATDATTLGNYSIPGMIVTQASYNGTTFVATLTVYRVPDASTVALWEFDESAASSNLADWSSNAVPLTQNNSPGVTTGVLFSARSFNGTSQFFGPNASGETARVALAGNMTVEHWVNLTTTVNPFWDLVSLCNSGTANGALVRTGVRLSDRQFYMSWETGTPGGGVFASAFSGSSGIVPLSTATHIACRRTLVSGSYVADFFLNGVPVGSTGSLAAPSGGQAGCVWLIGKDEASSTNFMTGAMDETRVSSVARSNAEIYSSYALGTSAAPFGTSFTLTVSNVKDVTNTLTIASPGNTFSFLKGSYSSFVPPATEASNFIHPVQTWSTSDTPFTAPTTYAGGILPYHHGTQHNKGHN